MRTTLLLFLAAYLCLSCTNPQTTCEAVTSFPQTADLKAEILPVPVPVLLPRYIGIMGDYLYIYKEKEEKLFAIGTSKEMDGSMVDYRRFYLLKKKGNRVHCISLSLREKFYKESPDMQNLISHILDSFKVN